MDLNKGLNQILFAVIIIITTVLVIVLIYFYANNSFVDLELNKNLITSTGDSDNGIKSFEWTLTLFGILMTIIVLGFTIVSYFNQKYQEEKFFNFINEKIDFEKTRIELTKSFDDNINRLNKKFSIEEIKKIVNENVNQQFKTKYKQEIFDNTKRFTAESLLIIPELHNRSTSLIRSTINNIIPYLVKCCDKETAKIISMNFHILNNNLLIITRLFSADKKLIMSGLFSLSASPFKEIEPYLILMEKKYINDPDIYPLVLDALKAIESLE